MQTSLCTVNDNNDVDLDYDSDSDSQSNRVFCRKCCTRKHHRSLDMCGVCANKCIAAHQREIREEEKASKQLMKRAQKAAAAFQLGHQKAQKVVERRHYAEKLISDALQKKHPLARRVAPLRLTSTTPLLLGHSTPVITEMQDDAAPAPAAMTTTPLLLGPGITEKQDDNILTAPPAAPAPAANTEEELANFRLREATRFLERFPHALDTEEVFVQAATACFGPLPPEGLRLLLTCCRTIRGV